MTGFGRPFSESIRLGLMTPAFEVNCDPADDAIRRHPFEIYKILQEHDPVHWSPAVRAWIVTCYDDVRQTLMTP